ncbi:MAG TPA: hypothetical protein VJT31_19310 [Rugosimonospora sp.]|nr:hypothetical protein [Rugosimonospora sp.]
MAVPPTRHRSWVPQVLLAIVFLAIIGGSAGYLAAHRQLQREARTADGATATPGPECPKHTETLAGVGQLRQLLYIHTTASEVWICTDTSGRLYYQGHLGQPGQALIEGATSLFLATVQREGPDGYVATNTDPKTGEVTKYHVTPQALRREHVGHPPDAYEPALPN